MSGSAECVVKAPEGPWLTHHHHSFLSHLTYKIKDTGSQKKQSKKTKTKKQTLICPKPENQPRISNRQGTSLSLPFKEPRDRLYMPSFLKEEMRHFTDPVFLPLTCSTEKSATTSATHTAYRFLHMQLAFLCILTFFFIFSSYLPFLWYMTVRQTTGYDFHVAVYSVVSLSVAA